MPRRRPGRTERSPWTPTRRAPRGVRVVRTRVASRWRRRRLDRLDPPDQTHRLVGETRAQVAIVAVGDLAGVAIELEVAERLVGDVPQAAQLAQLGEPVRA